MKLKAIVEIPEDFELSMFESKGYFPTQISLNNGDVIELTFYDIYRFTQDIESELKEEVAVGKTNVIFLKKVSREEIGKAMIFLNQKDYFSKLYLQK